MCLIAYKCFLLYTICLWAQNQEKPIPVFLLNFIECELSLAFISINLVDIYYTACASDR